MADPAFFETGKTYIRDEPFKAPELLDVFRCVYVAANPRNGEPRAFGFGGTALLRDNDWYSTALTPENWADGWAEHDGQPPEYPGTPGEGWCDVEGDHWVHCADGKMRMLADDADAQDPHDLDAQYGPLDPLVEEPSDVGGHSCSNCSGIDPETCQFNGENGS